MSDIAANPGRPSRGWCRALLFGSLCLNVALGGYIGAQVWFLSELRPLAALAQPRQIIVRIASRLPSADAELLRSAYAGKEDELAAARADTRASAVRLFVTMAKPDMTPEALRAAIEETRTRRVRQNEILTGVFIDAVGKMSPEGRRDMVARFRDAFTRFGENSRR